MRQAPNRRAFPTLSHRINVFSIGEISHWIHDRFGHATQVDGEVYHTSNEVNVSVRVGNNPLIETHGTEEELPTLIQAAATRVYAQTVRQAPSFAPAYNDWGDLLYAKGDLPGAITKYGDANQRSPHWADPLKGWGDVLAKQGNAKQALAKYEDALRYAPNWVALRKARDAAAMQKT
jgi:tetratricopeptide (TPR) repeat protein